jgi:hypothetical protein
MQSESVTKPSDSLVVTSRGAIAEFILGLVASVQTYNGVERRADPRFPISIPVKVTPYNTQGNRSREKFVAVTRDMSASGIAFLHTAPVEEDFWLLEFGHPQTEGVRLALQVLYRRPVGPLWEIAGRFVTEPQS